MKDKIFVFVIGLLVGAVISTGAFLAYSSINKNDSNMPAMNGGTPPSMPGDSSSSNQPPEKPSDNNTETDKTSNEV